MLEANAIISHRLGRVHVTDSKGESSVGTAFFYSNTFHMLTCAHVVCRKDDNVEISVYLPAVDKTLPAKLVVANEDQKFDLAVILLQVPENSAHIPTQY